MTPPAPSADAVLDELKKKILADDTDMINLDTGEESYVVKRKVLLDWIEALRRTTGTADKGGE